MEEADDPKNISPCIEWRLLILLTDPELTRWIIRGLTSTSPMEAIPPAGGSDALGGNAAPALLFMLIWFDNIDNLGPPCPNGPPSMFGGVDVRGDEDILLSAPAPPIPIPMFKLRPMFMSPNPAPGIPVGTPIADDEVAEESIVKDPLMSPLWSSETRRPNEGAWFKRCSS